MENRQVLQRVAHKEMAHGEIHGKRTRELVDEITEEQFLKDLHLFMRMRDTPIERIPHLGFKQIDLFVMFKTVRDMGGYHLVTAQQLWKQVYNRLGGNPRSTSAATCTRRHYEKLLLPYECHKKCILMNALPQHQPKLLHDINFNKDDEDGQRPAKRKLLSAPLHQTPRNLQSEPRGNNFPLPLQYPHYYHPSHAVRPPYVSIPSSVLTSQSTPSPEPQFSFHPTHLNTTDRVKEPLEHLRDLAEQYKTSSGLAEPLNLSIKAQSQEADRNPASSFAPPSSGKNPKFLNKPSPLYTPHRPPVMRSDECETQDGEADVTSYSYPAKEGEEYVIDVTTSSGNTPEHTPTMRTDKGATAMAPKSSSPKRDFTIRPKEAREGNSEVRGLNLSNTLPSPPQDNGGKMEIQIPLAMFQSWLRLCGSSAMINGVKQLHTLPTLEGHSAQRNCSDTEVLPTNLSLHTDHQHWSLAAEDLRVRQKSVPSPPPTPQTTENHHHTSQNHFISYKPLTSCGILKSASSWDVYPVDQQDVNQSYGSKASNSWDAYKKETPTSHNRVKTVSSPLTVQRDITATKSHYEEPPRGEKDSSEMGPSSVLMVNSGSASLLHLTTEEVMKLKKIISSSL
ncbi:ARID domain containing protein [Scophthalmus maximus]|uniref:ARID domain containing protein n=1 Tax=Scophthalmus maximus TaxID=52904 RepID=A0A2U9CG47_SCOMX|nr:ARID domain containing protein [Scophthalmus maximus]